MRHDAERQRPTDADGAHQTLRAAVTGEDPERGLRQPHSRVVGGHAQGARHRQLQSAAEAALCAGKQGAFWAVHDLSFEVKRGEMFGIVGAGIEDGDFAFADNVGAGAGEGENLRRSHARDRGHGS